MNFYDFFLLLTGSPELQPVFVGYFWALFGLIFNIVDDKTNKNIKKGKKVSFFEFIKYSMSIVIVMRFTSLVINIEDMSFGGFIVGLSIRNLPNLIKNVKNKYINNTDATQ